MPSELGVLRTHASPNRILSLPLATTRAERELDLVGPEIAQPPEHKEAFEFRRKQCLMLLREASALS